MIRNDITQQPVVQVASWTLGEFGDLFVGGQNHEEKVQVNSNQS
jgi:AP-1 complex subunit gamma-1